MFAATRRVALLAALAVPALFAATTNTARADDDPNAFTDTYGVYVANRTADTVTYQMRWGTRSWKTYTLAPGKARIHTDTIFDDMPQLTPSLSFNDSNEKELCHKLAVSHYPDKDAIDAKYAFKPTADGGGYKLVKVAR